MGGGNPSPPPLIPVISSIPDFFPGYGPMGDSMGQGAGWTVESSQQLASEKLNKYGFANMKKHRNF